jgi:hypothetical protein
VLQGRLVHLIVAWELFGFLSTLLLTQYDPTSVGYQEVLVELAGWKRCIEHMVGRFGNQDGFNWPCEGQIHINLEINVISVTSMLWLSLSRSWSSVNTHVTLFLYEQNMR